MATNGHLARRSDLNGYETDAASEIVMQCIGVRFLLRNDRGAVRALQELSLTIPRARFVTVIGPSGCGKSTLLKVVAGLVRPSSGTVEVGGRPPAPGDPSLAIMLQKPLLLPWRTVLDNALLPLDVAGRRREADVERVRRLLATVGLAAFERAYPHELSMGMQQRVALARTFVNEPRVLLMDEPFAALDELTREAMNVELLRMWGQSPKTVVFVTHSLSEAVFLADTVVVLSGEGRLVDILDVDLPRPRDPAIAETGQFLAWVRKARCALESRR